MKTYPFLYILEFYDEVDEKVKTESGVTFTSTYAHAMSNIEKYYGDHIISINTT